VIAPASQIGGSSTLQNQESVDAGDDCPHKPPNKISFKLTSDINERAACVTAAILIHMRRTSHFAGAGFKVGSNQREFPLENQIA
jgi:hypothetical protein